MTRLIDADKLKGKKKHSKEFAENIVSVAEIDWQPTVEAIPIEWIEQYLYDLVVGKEKHVINVGEILSMSDEEYYLKHLIKRWKQEQEKRNDS